MAARRFLERAIDLHDPPEKVTIDKSGANTAAIDGVRSDSGVDIELRQSKYLNNIVEQDHRAIKRIVRPMLGFKSFRCARSLIAGIETMHHPHLMPIENAGVLWPEELSSRVSVATLQMPRQKLNSPAQMKFARRQSYNPWHTTPDHRPLGNQSRARKRMYWALSTLRHNMNAVPHYEPTGDEVFE